MLDSMRSIAANPIIEARPFVISAEGVKKAKVSGFLFRKAGTREPAMTRMKRTAVPVGSSAIWRRTESPEESSAPRAATKPIMASLPLISSGLPENPMTVSNEGRLAEELGFQRPEIGTSFSIFLYSCSDMVFPPEERMDGSERVGGK